MSVNIEAKISAHYPITADGNYQVDVQIHHPSIGIKILYGKTFDTADNQVFYFLNESDGKGEHIDQPFPNPVPLKKGDSFWIMTYLIPTIKSNNTSEFVVDFGVGAGDTSEISAGEAAQLKVSRTTLTGTPNLSTFGTFPGQDSFVGTSSQWWVGIDHLQLYQSNTNALVFDVTKGNLEEEVNMFLVNPEQKIRGFWGMNAQGTVDAQIADYPDSESGPLKVFALVSGKPMASVPTGFLAGYKFSVGDPEKDGKVKLSTV